MPNLINPAELAIDIVYKEVNAFLELSGGRQYKFEKDVLVVVWSCKTLQNWKAMVWNAQNTNYYEVTHNGDKNETYIDTWTKSGHIKIEHNADNIKDDVS